MKRLIAVFLLLSSFNVIADERIEFNQQTFVLKSGFCMSVFKGESQFGWCITSFSTVAEQKISQQLAERLAFKACDLATINCKWFKAVCAN